MPAIYDRRDIQFQYPENWTLAEEQLDEWPRSVTVQSPGGGFWTVHVYPPDSDPQNLIGEVLRAMRQEYTDLESDVIIEAVADTQAVGYSMEFYCLDFVVSARTLAFSTPSQTYLFVFQAETREFSQLLPVFQAMIVSLAQARQT